jgi:hypothetical protein
VIHNFDTNRFPPGIIIAGSRLTVLITAHGLEAKTDTVPSEDLDPRHTLTRCNIALCDLVLRLPRLLPAPSFVEVFEKRLCRPPVVKNEIKFVFLSTRCHM